MTRRALRNIAALPRVLQGTISNAHAPTSASFRNYSVIDEAKSNLGSIYNALQTSLRLQGYHGLTGQFSYTWSHAIDYETGLLPYLPQNPLNEAAERGNSDFDVRNTFVGNVNYAVPAFKGPKHLMEGWSVTGSLAFHGGTPYTVLPSTNPSGNGDSADRAVQVDTRPNAVSHGINAVSPGAVQWFSPTAFVDAPTGVYSPTRRGQNYNPGYNSIDLNVTKNTQIFERAQPPDSRRHFQRLQPHQPRAGRFSVYRRRRADLFDHRTLPWQSGYRARRAG